MSIIFSQFKNYYADSIREPLLPLLCRHVGMDRFRDFPMKVENHYYIVLIML